MANSNENLNVVSRPGQVTIEDVRISAGGGSMSILGQLLSLDFFESIFSPFMIGNMVVDDGIGLIRNLPITGRELISIRYKTPLDRGEIKEVNLQIVSQINRTRTDRRNDTTQFRLLSPTGFSDLNQKLSRSYEGTNSEIVKEICKEYYGEKVSESLLVEPTSGKAKYALSFKKPSEHIQALASQSFSAREDKKFSGYLFYETRSGFKFKSLPGLFYQSPKPDHYYVDSKVDRANFEMDEYSFQNHIMRDVVFPRGFDRPTQVSGGGFGGLQIIVDPTQKAWGNEAISYDNSPVPLKNNDTQKPIIESSSPLYKTAALIYLSNRQSQNIDQSQNTSTDMADTHPYSKMNYLTHSDTSITFTVPGDSTLEAGITVALILTKNESDLSIEQTDVDDEKTGLYLIKSLHNKFYFPPDGKIEMKTSLECVRNFRGQPVPDTINTGGLSSG